MRFFTRPPAKRLGEKVILLKLWILNAVLTTADVELFFFGGGGGNLNSEAFSVHLWTLNQLEMSIFGLFTSLFHKTFRPLCGLFESLVLFSVKTLPFFLRYTD